MRQVVVREGRLNDLDMIKAVADHPQIKRAARFVTLGELRSAIQGGYMFVAEVDGVVVGFLEGNPRSRPKRIYFMAIHPDHQGKGLGSALVKQFCGDDPVIVNVTLTSTRFWRKLGFKRVGKPMVRMFRQGKTAKPRFLHPLLFWDLDIELDQRA